MNLPVRISSYAFRHFFLMAASVSAVSAQSSQYATFWQFDRDIEATIQIVNTESEERLLSIDLLLWGVVEVRLEPIMIASRARVEIDVRDALKAARSVWGPLGVEAKDSSLWGSAVLQAESFRGIHGWIVTEGDQLPLSFNSMFRDEKNADSSLVSNWWRPLDSTQVIFAVSNVLRHDITVSPKVLAGGQQLQAQQLKLRPLETRLLTLRSLIGSLEGQLSDFSVHRVGGLRLDVEGAEQALQALTLLRDDTLGMSVPLLMHGSRFTLSTSMHHPGAPIGAGDPATGFPGGIHFSPNLLVTNTTPEERSLSLVLRPKASIVLSTCSVRVSSIRRRCWT